MTQDRVLSEDELFEIDGLSPATRRRLEQAGLYPRRFKIGAPDSRGGRVGWSAIEHAQWLENRKAARGDRS
jgi:predicted DNA-binding transcriptional regulator AlpA